MALLESVVAEKSWPSADIYSYGGHSVEPTVSAARNGELENQQNQQVLISYLYLFVILNYYPLAW